LSVELDTVAAAEELAPSPASDKRSVGKLFVRGSIWSLVQYGSGQLIRLGSNLILWRLLYPDAFGLMAIVNSFIVGLAMFSDIGIGQNVVRHERGDEPDFLNTIWTIQVLRGLALMVLGIAGAIPVARFYHQRELAALIPMVALGGGISAFNSTKLYSASRRMALGRLTMIELVSQVAGLIAMNIWAYLQHSVWALAGGAAIGSAVKLALSHLALPGIRNRFRWDRTTLDEVSHFGRWILVSTLLTFFASASDRLIFGKLVSIAMLGVYSIGAVWATIPGYVVGHVVGNVLFPLISRVKRSELAVTFRNLRGTVLMAAAWLVACLIAGGPVLIRFLYDKRAVEAGPVVQLLAIGSWFCTLESANGSAVLSMGKTKWLALGNGAKFAAMLVLMPIGGIFFGFKTTVLALSLSEVVRYGISARACALIGLNPLRQDALLSAGIAVTSVLGLAVASLYTRLHLPISNTRIDAFVEGAIMFLVLTSVWLAAFLIRRRRLQPALPAV